MLELCNNLLDQFHKTSKALQDPQIAPTKCTKLYTSLYHFVKGNLPDVDYKCVNRNSQWWWCT